MKLQDALNLIKSYFGVGTLSEEEMAQIPGEMIAEALQEIEKVATDKLQSGKSEKEIRRKLVNEIIDTYSSQRSKLVLTPDLIDFLKEKYLK